jgi:catechol 2,3-dioxygenase-like lactoylglutathione lyase family enzyme
VDASRAVVKQLGHVVARVDDPRAVFDAFTETLGLPVAWPLASYPAFESGGVALALSVFSLERAETALRESGMISTVTDDELTINPAKLEGLLVRLVQQEGGGYEGSRRYQVG